jgi:hypothetical protein
LLNGQKNPRFIHPNFKSQIVLGQPKENKSEIIAIDYEEDADPLAFNVFFILTKEITKCEIFRLGKK